MKTDKIKSLDSIHQFIHIAEILKRLLRHSWLSNGRQESVAEHTWRMALMAMLLAPEVEGKIDIGKVVQMIMIHDLAEIEAGDYHAFKKVPRNKHDLERKALRNLIINLPKNTREMIMSLWIEFEERKTSEAKLAQAMDKLEVLIQHNEAGTKTWDDKEFDFNYYYGYDKVDHSRVLTVFRDLVLEETIKEIEEEIK